MKPTDLATYLEFLAQRLRSGCGNAGCCVKPPTGMHTNGACHCSPRKYASALMGQAIECERQGNQWDKTE